MMEIVPRSSVEKVGLRKADCLKFVSRGAEW
jgi:hypothetical protein